MSIEKRNQSGNVFIERRNQRGNVSIEDYKKKLRKSLWYLDFRNDRISVEEEMLSQGEKIEKGFHESQE